MPAPFGGSAWGFSVCTAYRYADKMLSSRRLLFGTYLGNDPNNKRDQHLEGYGVIMVIFQKCKSFHCTLVHNSTQGKHQHADRHYDPLMILYLEKSRRTFGSR
jgi:hypothetical protein